MKRILYIAAGLLLWCATLQETKAQNVSKYQAVFIYTFTKYIEWPESKPPLVIGVLGDSPVLSELEKSAKAKNGAFEVMKVASMDEVGKCDIIFLPKKQSQSLALVIQKAKGENVLIIAEDKALATQGANISFYIRDNKLRFILNKDATTAQNIKVSSSLLSLAEVI